MQRKRKTPADLGDDLFSAEPGTFIKLRLSGLAWPAQGRFPVNHHQARVGDVVTRDLASSERPLLIAGYSSIGALIEQVADWCGARSDRPGDIRLLLGSEPFPSRRTYFGSPESNFTEEVYEYWQEHSVSVRLSAKIIHALGLLDGGSLKVRVRPV
jgi:hypothetical protein